jgi:hypothetical protein
MNALEMVEKLPQKALQARRQKQLNTIKERRAVEASYPTGGEVVTEERDQQSIPGSYFKVHGYARQTTTQSALLYSKDHGIAHLGYNGPTIQVSILIQTR